MQITALAYVRQATLRNCAGLLLFIPGSMPWYALPQCCLSTRINLVCNRTATQLVRHTTTAAHLQLVRARLQEAIECLQGSIAHIEVFTALRLGPKQHQKQQDVVWGAADHVCIDQGWRRGSLQGPRQTHPHDRSWQQYRQHRARKEGCPARSHSLLAPSWRHSRSGRSRLEVL